MQPEDLFILGVIAGSLFLYVLFKTYRSIQFRQKMKRAKEAEGRALQFLSQRGFQIVDIQKRVPIVTMVDGKPYHNALQADYLVSKDGRNYVVEVKTGEEATRITNTQTRRQLLEYYLVYRPDGILLLDMERQEIREVSFQLDLPGWDLRPPMFFSPLVAQLISFALGALTVMALLKGGFFH